MSPNDLFGEKSERNAQVRGNIETKQMEGTKMRKCIYLNVILIMVWIFVPFEILGGEITGVHKKNENKAPHHDESHGHRHHIALFLGNTHHEDENEFTVGLDYEYRFNPIFGIGGLIDHTGGHFDSTVFAVPVFIHPVNNLKFFGAPGFENKEGENEFLVRVGAIYDIHIGNYSISPTFSADFVNGEKIMIFGLGFGLSF
jgi:hypothetical protein